jgi:hypothetical protein
LRVTKCRVIGVTAAGLALAACTTAPPTQSSLGTDNAAAPSSNTLAQRDLTPQEKKIIADAIAPSIRDAGSAKYKWTKISISIEGATNYCAMVNAKSPYPAYSGWQAYIVEATTVGGTVSSAVVGLIAGGKDAALVAKMCAKYGLNPNDAT